LNAIFQCRTIGIPCTPEAGNAALSLGERVAIPQSREYQVRGYFVVLPHLIPPQRATDPSPDPLRLVKAPAAGHPLPKGEGCISDFLPLSTITTNLYH
jgi:hypothetical protein